MPLQSCFPATIHFKHRNEDSSASFDFLSSRGENLFTFTLWGRDGCKTDGVKTGMERRLVFIKIKTWSICVGASELLSNGLSRPRVFQVTLVSRKLIITHGEVLNNQKASEDENNCSFKICSRCTSFSRAFAAISTLILCITCYSSAIVEELQIFVQTHCCEPNLWKKLKPHVLTKI